MILQLRRCSSFPSLVPWWWPSPLRLSVSWTSYLRSWSRCRCRCPARPALRALRCLPTRTLAWAHRRWHLRGSLFALALQTGGLLLGNGYCRRSWRTPGRGLRTAESRGQVHRLMHRRVSLQQEAAVLDWHPGWLLTSNRNPRWLISKKRFWKIFNPI